MKSAVVLLSGGMDSTCLYWSLLSQGYTVHALSVDYGQRHSCELDAAQHVVRAALDAFQGPEDGQVGEHEIVDLTTITSLMAGSSQTSDDVPVPHGHYAEESMKATVVPNRNMVLISLATAWAVSLKTGMVGVAAHAGDHAIYPDCRPEFMTAMAQAMGIANYEPVKLYTPFISLSKTDIVRVGATIGAPFQLTYSCYEGKPEHCGKCGTCTERKESFFKAGVADPTVYADVIAPMPVEG